MESLVSYGEGIGITDLIRYLTGTSTNSEEGINIYLVHDTTWPIKNPQWGSNPHWIYDANK